MKHPFALLACLFTLVGSGFYYVTQTTQTALFDKHIIDSIHFPKINTFFEAADAYKFAQDYAHARIAFEKLLPETKRIEDSIYIFNQLAYCSLAMNEDSEATLYIQKLAHHFPNIEKSTPSVLGDYFYNKGVLCYRLFHPDEAETYLKLALSYYQHVYGHQHLKTAMCLTELGMLNYDFLRIQDSISHYLLNAYDIYQSSEKLIPFSAYNELGMALNNYMSRNYEIAQAHCENALHLAALTPVKDSLLMARAQSYKGQMFKKKAELIKDNPVFKNRLLDSAEIEFNHALHFFSKPTHPRTQELYRNSLVLHIYRQDSIKFTQQLATLNQIVAKSFDYFAFEDRLNGYFYKEKNIPKAIASYKSFLENHYKDSICSPALKDEALWALSGMYNKTNLFDSTIYYISFWTTNGKKSSLDLDNYAEVQKHSTIHNHFVPLNQLGLAYLKKYEQQKNLSDLKKAVKAYRLADSFFVKRANYDVGTTALSVQAEVGRGLYHNGLKAVYALHDKTHDPKLLDLAFLFCERMKSSILFRDLKIQSNNDTIKFLNQQLDKLMGEREVTSKSNFALSSALTKLSRQLDLQLKTSSIADSMTMPSIETIRKTLNKGQAIVEYYSGEPTFALFISKEKVVFHKIDTKDSLLDKNRQIYRDCLAKFKSNEINKTETAFSNAAFFLYGQLLKPFEALLEQQKEVVFVPDKDLSTIPFEAFVTHQNWKGFKNAPYLIKKNYAISYAPSWKIYTRSLTQQPQSDYKAVCFSYGEGQSDLVCSPKEIKAISTILGDTNVKSLSGNYCTTANFMHEWQNGRYDILHVSLHAKGNLNNMFDNKIWFDAGKKDFVYGFDLSGKKSTISLIVLSACETAFGNVAAGEGAYSMSRYFFQAGAKTVVASLWKIDDCQNATIIDSFYAHLKKGQKAKQALYTAKRLFLAENKADDFLYYPNLWAGTICLE